MHIDNTISIGQILSSIGLVVAGLGAWYGMKYQVAALVKIIEDHSRRIDNIDNTLDEHERQLNLWRGARVGQHYDS